MTDLVDSTIQSILQEAAGQIAAYVKGSDLAQTIGINETVGGVVGLSITIGMPTSSNDGFVNLNARAIANISPIASSSNCSDCSGDGGDGGDGSECGDSDGSDCGDSDGSDGSDSDGSDGGDGGDGGD